MRALFILTGSLGVAVIFGAAAEAKGPISGWRRTPEGSLSIQGFTLTRKLERRRPVGTVTEVACGARGKVYAHLTVLNKGAPTTLLVRWERAGRLHHVSSLRVGRSPAWKTWAYLRLGAAVSGRWTAVVQDQRGTELQRRSLLICR